jgi:hypothetical protein
VACDKCAGVAMAIPVVSGADLISFYYAGRRQLEVAGAADSNRPD